MELLINQHYRAVDEMFKTCEQDFSVEQCINVVHTMELCMEDFKRVRGRREGGGGGVGGNGERKVEEENGIRGRVLI